MTAGEIETLLRAQIIALQPPISGGVYFKGMRPRRDAATEGLEDCEVLVLTGSGSEVVEGTCVVNIYVPDTFTQSGQYLRKKGRTDALEAWLRDLPPRLRSGRIYFKTDGLVTTEKEQSTNEHFATLKMKFKVQDNNY